MTPESLAQELSVAVAQDVERLGGSTVAVKPAHRVRFHWPPHPISYSYHVLASDWTGEASFEAHGETFPVKVAKTPYGVFGRCDSIWHEDRGETEREMLEALKTSSEPLFQRQIQINTALGLPGRFTGIFRNLQPLDLLRLLYCENRDVANDAKSEIEVHASTHLFLPALLSILQDRSHPHRRSAQWCVLDLFEDISGFATTLEEQEAAGDAIRDLIWDAEDDYARTIYKAGVVMGGHMPDNVGAPRLLQCVEAPSRIGRRSAIHGLFHVVEWFPSRRAEVVAALTAHLERESDPRLLEFTKSMAYDLEHLRSDHHPEPVFDDEI